MDDYIEEGTYECLLCGQNTVTDPSEFECNDCKSIAAIASFEDIEYFGEDD